MARILALLVTLVALSANAAELPVKVVQITDGDTVGVIDAEKRYFKVRLSGIDAPERKQSFHEKSKEALAAKVFEKDIILDESGKDRYGRTLGVILLDGRNINREMVAEGWSHWFQKYAPKDLALKESEAGARQKKLGLWADPMPVPPWDYRSAVRAK